MSIHLVRVEHIAESLTGTVRHEEGEHYCRRWKFHFTDSGMENIKLHFSIRNRIPLWAISIWPLETSVQLPPPSSCCLVWFLSCDSFLWQQEVPKESTSMLTLPDLSSFLPSLRADPSSDFTRERSPAQPDFYSISISKLLWDVCTLCNDIFPWLV